MRHPDNMYDGATSIVIHNYEGGGMAVLNIRVEDRIRDQLKEMADAEGVTVSEYVRDLVMAAIVPVYERPVQHGDEPAPESMRIADRQMLSMLHRILARVLPEEANDEDGDADYQLRRARVIESGFTGEYWQEVAGFRTELSKRDCGRVLDILDMFRVITYSIKRLEEQGVTVSEDLSYELEFHGFDHNDGLESHMASYVEHLMADGPNCGRSWSATTTETPTTECSTRTCGCSPSTAASRTAAAGGPVGTTTCCPWTSWSRSPRPGSTRRTAGSSAAITRYDATTPAGAPRRRGIVRDKKRSGPNL